MATNNDTYKPWGIEHRSVSSEREDTYIINSQEKTFRIKDIFKMSLDEVKATYLEVESSDFLDPQQKEILKKALLIYKAIKQF